MYKQALHVSYTYYPPNGGSRFVVTELPAEALLMGVTKWLTNQEAIPYEWILNDVQLVVEEED